MSNIVNLPPTSKELTKDELILKVRQSITDLQKFIVIGHLPLFTAFDILDLEESKDRLELTWETLRGK